METEEGKTAASGELDDLEFWLSKSDAPSKVLITCNTEYLIGDISLVACICKIRLNLISRCPPPPLLPCTCTCTLHQCSWLHMLVCVCVRVHAFVYNTEFLLT